MYEPDRIGKRQRAAPPLFIDWSVLLSRSWFKSETRRRITHSSGPEFPPTRTLRQQRYTTEAGRGRTAGFLNGRGRSRHSFLKGGRLSSNRSGRLWSGKRGKKSARVHSLPSRWKPADIKRGEARPVSLSRSADAVLVRDPLQHQWSFVVPYGGATELSWLTIYRCSLKLSQTCRTRGHPRHARRFTTALRSLFRGSCGAWEQA